MAFTPLFMVEKLVYLLILLTQKTLATRTSESSCTAGFPNCKLKSNTSFTLIESCCLNHTLQLIEDNVTLDGNGATITCGKKDHGIIISNSSLVLVKNLTLENCGVKAPGLKRTSALTIIDCGHVSLVNVVIRDSIGTGLSLIDSYTKVTIESSTFSNNSMTSIKEGGGGAFINQSNHNNVNYSIANSHFIRNRAAAKSQTYLPSSINTHTVGDGGGFSFYLNNASGVHICIKNVFFEGNCANRGGGLFLGLEQNCMDNHVEVLESVFDANHCVTQKIPKNLTSSGGGLAFLDHSHMINGNNTFKIKNSRFTNNTAYYGGGLSAGMRAFRPSKEFKESIDFTLDNCSLLGNTARIGSAVDLFCYTSRELTSSCILKPLLKNMTITDNNGIYTYANESITENTFSTVHVEALQASFEGDNVISNNKASGIGLDDAVMEMYQNSSLVLENNMASAGGGIAIIGNSEVLLRPSTNLTIVGNSVADRGGGIYSAQTLDTYNLFTYDCFIKYVNKDDSTSTPPDEWNAHITIMNNTADGESSCIFASSIYPCVWPSNSTNITEDIHNTFCGWKSWKMGNDCWIGTLPNKFTHTQYHVSVYPMNATKIEDFDVVDDLGHTVTNTTVFSVCISDGQDKKCSENHNKMIMDINRNVLTMEGGVPVTEEDEPHQYSLLVQTTGLRTVSTNLNVSFKGCPVGYKVIEQNGGQCQCNSYVHKGIVNCGMNSSFLILDVLLGHCIGYHPNYSVVYSRCPYTICKETIYNPYIAVPPLTRKEVNDKFCEPYNRTGFLCKNCKDKNDGINVFSPTYECIKCKHHYRGWIYGISAALVPQVVFFAVVIIFHIGITAPSMNAYIFFSHVTLLPIQVLLIQIASKLDVPKHLEGSDAMARVVLAPYRIWTFDYPEIVGLKACFGPNFKIMHALAFRYVQAFFPTILVLLTLALIELHARNCKPVVYLWKPLCYVCIRLRRKWELRTSVIDAFATVVLLSYSKIVNTSISLLTRNSVYVLDNNSTDPYQVKEVLLDLDTSTEYFKKDHVYFAIAAILVLCTFGLVPPLLLIFYPYMWFKKLLSLAKCDKWHGLYAFVETFQGCYKDGTNKTPDRRWFAGIYFVFRIIIFLEFALINDVSSMFVKLAFTYVMFLLFFIMLRPYKKDYYNYLDAAFLALLVSINLFVYYLIVHAQIQKSLYKNLWHLTYTLLLLPTLYLALYASYLVCTRSKCLRRHCLSRLKCVPQRSFRYLAETRLRGSFFQDDAFSILGGELVPSQSPLDNLSEVPDRIDNPDRYGDFDKSSRLPATAYFSDNSRKPRREDREKLL